MRLGDVLLYNSTDAVYAYHPRTGAIERMRLSEMKKTDVFCGICGMLLPAAQQSPESSVTAGIIDASDRALLLSGGSFNRPVSGAASSVYDLNGDGCADFLDLAILTSASGWGKTAASRKVQLS